MQTDYEFARLPNDPQDEIAYRLRFFFDDIEQVAFERDTIVVKAACQLSLDDLEQVLNDTRQSHRRGNLGLPPTRVFGADAGSVLSYMFGSARANAAVLLPTLGKVLDRQRQTGSTTGPGTDRAPDGYRLCDGQAAQLQRYVETLLQDIAVSIFGAEELIAPSSIDFGNLRDLGFLKSSSQQLVYIGHSRKEPSTFGALQATAQTGFHDVDAVGAHVATTGRCLNPALCLHVYPQFRDTAFEPGTGAAVTLAGRCHRDEGGNTDDAYRLAEFSMREIVFVGAPDWVEARYREVALVAWVLGAVFDDDFAVSTASDIFFDPDAGLRRSSQLTQANKLELRANAAGSASNVSFGSINRHGTHFAAPMAIRSGSQTASSMCFGLGLDRYVRLLTANGITNVPTLSTRLQARYASMAQKTGADTFPQTRPNQTTESILPATRATTKTTRAKGPRSK